MSRYKITRLLAVSALLILCLVAINSLTLDASGYPSWGGVATSDQDIPTPENYPLWDSGLEAGPEADFLFPLYPRADKLVAQMGGTGIIRGFRIEVASRARGLVNPLDNVWMSIRQPTDATAPARSDAVALVVGAYTDLDSFRVTSLGPMTEFEPVVGRDFSSLYVTRLSDTTVTSSVWAYRGWEIKTFIPFSAGATVWLWTAQRDTLTLCIKPYVEYGALPDLGVMYYCHIDEVPVTCEDTRKAHSLFPLVKINDLGAGTALASTWSMISNYGNQEVSLHGFVDRDLPYAVLTAATPKLSSKLVVNDLDGWEFDYPLPWKNKRNYFSGVYLTDGTNRDSAEYVAIGTNGAGEPSKFYKTLDSLSLSTSGRYAAHAIGDTAFAICDADVFTISQNHSVVAAASGSTQFSRSLLGDYKTIGSNYFSMFPHGWSHIFRPSLDFNSSLYLYGMLTGSGSGPIHGARNVVISWTQQRRAAVSVPVVTAPNGGESWKRHSRNLISWTAGNQHVQNYSIYLSTDGGSTWPTLITSGFSGDSLAYAWKVNDAVGTTARVKVVSFFESDSASDASNADFTIATSTVTDRTDSLSPGDYAAYEMAGIWTLADKLNATTTDDGYPASSETERLWAYTTADGCPDAVTLYRLWNVYDLTSLLSAGQSVASVDSAYLRWGNGSNTAQVDNVGDSISCRIWNLDQNWVRPGKYPTLTEGLASISDAWRLVSNVNLTVPKDLTGFSTNSAKVNLPLTSPSVLIPYIGDSLHVAWGLSRWDFGGENHSAEFTTGHQSRQLVDSTAFKLVIYWKRSE